MGSSGKRGQLPTSVVPNQQTHPSTGRLFGTYYTLNAIPHPSLSTTSKHLERSRLSRLAGRDTKILPSILQRIGRDCSYRLFLQYPFLNHAKISLYIGCQCHSLHHHHSLLVWFSFVFFFRNSMVVSCFLGFTSPRC
ncbi:hypothetical protein GQ457_13G012550 [Hibiscus cannabinus]